MVGWGVGWRWGVGGIWVEVGCWWDMGGWEMDPGTSPSFSLLCHQIELAKVYHGSAMQAWGLKTGASMQPAFTSSPPGALKILSGMGVRHTLFRQHRHLGPCLGAASAG
jgi:hypothetical protein